MNILVINAKVFPKQVGDTSYGGGGRGRKQSDHCIGVAVSVFSKSLALKIIGYDPSLAKYLVFVVETSIYQRFRGNHWIRDQPYG